VAPVTALAPGERVDRISLPAALAEAEAAGPGPLLARTLMTRAGGAARPGRGRRRRAVARARVTRRETELADLERQVKAELLDALAREGIAREAVEAASAGVAAASEALAVRCVRERSGLESNLDVIKAARGLAQARFQQADALVDAALARLRARLAAGERLVGGAGSE
jgi:outer membrane protein TolC